MKNILYKKDNALSTTKTSNENDLQTLMQITLPKNLHNILSDLDNNILRAEDLIKKNLQESYSLINQSKKELSDIPALAETKNSNDDIIENNENDLTPQQPTLMDILAANNISAPQIQQRMNEITQSINERTEKITLALMNKTQAITQTAQQRNNNSATTSVLPTSSQPKDEDFIEHED